MNTLKIAIVDDHDFFREGLVMTVKRIPDFEVVFTAANGAEFLELIKTSLPDIVLMDIKMPVMDGVKATKKAIEIYPYIKILAITLFREKEYIRDMINAGAKGFLFKTSDKDEIENAIRKVNKHNYYFSRDVVNVLTDFKE